MLNISIGVIICSLVPMAESHQCSHMHSAVMSLKGPSATLSVDGAPMKMLLRAPFGYRHGHHMHYSMRTGEIIGTL